MSWTGYIDRWTGSDTNPNNNDGQGRQGTDRSNMILIRNITYEKEGALQSQTTGNFISTVVMYRV